MKNVLVTAGAVLAASGSAFAGLTNTANYFGNVGATMSGRAYANVTAATDSVGIGGIPAGATIKSAFVHANSWFTPVTPDFTFAGHNFGATAFNDFAPYSGGDLYDYRWDVTPYVTGNGLYNFDISGCSQLYGVALTVVYEDASLPLGSVHIYEGAEHVGEGHTTDSLTLHFLNAAAGPANFYLFTEADDTNTTGENIIFNGTNVGGPVDDNLGPFASLFHVPVTNNGIDELCTINTFGDWFGMHVGILSTNIPTPGALSLLGLGGVVAMRRRR